jgi:mono/diheme cytochrome c family protein
MAAEQWERRQGMRVRGGWSWSNWLPCTEAEAQRVTGLQSWQVRATGKCAACNGTGRVPCGVGGGGGGQGMEGGNG